MYFISRHVELCQISAPGNSLLQQCRGGLVWKTICHGMENKSKTSKKQRRPSHLLMFRCMTKAVISFSIIMVLEQFHKMEDGPEYPVHVLCPCRKEMRMLSWIKFSLLSSGMQIHYLRTLTMYKPLQLLYQFSEDVATYTYQWCIFPYSALGIINKCIRL